MLIFSTKKDEYGNAIGFDWAFDYKGKRERAHAGVDRDVKGLNRVLEYRKEHESETYFDKLPELMAGCSESAIDLAKDVDLSADSIEKYKQIQHSAIDSTVKFGGSLKTLGSALKGVGKTLASTGLNMLIGFAVSKGLELAFDAFDKWVNRVQYANEALEELGSNWEDISTKQQDAQKVLSQYADDYNRLSKGVNTQTGENISLNDAEYQRYLDANNAIANSALANIEGVTIAYDEQGNALVRLTGSTQTLADAYDMLAQKTRDEILSSEVMKNWNTQNERNFEQAAAGSNMKIGFANSASHYGKTGDWSMLQGYLAKVYSFDEIQTLNEKRDRATTEEQRIELLEEIKPTVDSYVEEILHAALKELNNSLDLPRRLASTVVEDTFANDPESYEKLNDSVQRMLVNIVDNLDYTYFVGKTDKELKDAVQKDFLVPLTEAGAQTALDSLNKAQSDFQQGKLSYGGYLKQGQATRNALVGAGANDDYITSLMSYMGLDGESVYDSYVAHLGAIVKDANEEWLRSRNRYELEFANELASPQGEAYLSMEDFTKKYNKTLQEQALSIDTLTESYAALTEAQTKAREIMQAIGTDGAMTLEQYKELVAMSPDYAKAVSGESGYFTVDYDKLRQINLEKTRAQQADVQRSIELNEQNYQNELKTLQELVAEYQSYANESEEWRAEKLEEITSSRDLIDSYTNQRIELHALASEMEYATSSYKRWLDAQDVAEKSDAFKSAKNAIEAIREGDESGRKNTEKYRAAEEYILGTEAAQMSKEARETALKRAESFYDKDGNFALDAWRKASLKAGAQRKDGTWAVGSIDEYAKMLGLSKEYTAQAVLALSEYNGSYGVNVSQALIDQAQELLPKTEVESNTDAILKLTEALVANTNAITEKGNGTDTKQETTETTESVGEPKSALAFFREYFASGLEQTKEKAQNIGNKGKELWGNLVEFIKPYAKTEMEQRFAELSSSIANPTDLIGEDTTANQSITNATEQIDALSGAAKTAAEELNRLAPQDETTEPEKHWYDGLLKFFGSGTMIAGEWVPTKDSTPSETGSIEDEPKTIEVDADTSEANAKIEKIDEELSKPRQVVITPVVKTPKGGASINQMAQPTYSVFASGTQNAPGGTSLVGEEEPEIVVSKKKGKWFLARGPQLVNLDKGDTVYNGKQTKNILNGRNVNGGNSYWRGLNQIAVNDGGSSAPQSTNGNGLATQPDKDNNKTTKNYNSILEKFSGLYDWIQRALEVAQKETQKLIDNVKDFVGYAGQNDALDKAIASTIKEREKNEAGYLRYLQQAEEVRKQTDLSDDIVSKIQNGTIDISEYDDTTKKKIEEYQRWYDLAEQCKDTIEELNDQERELSMRKLDNIIADFENRTESLSNKANKKQKEIELRQAKGMEVQESSYIELMENSQEQIDALTKERNVLEAEFLNQVASGVIKEGSEEWYKYLKALEDIDNSIIDCQVDMEEFGDSIHQLRIDKLNNVLGVLQQTQAATESLMSLHDAQGVNNTEGYYKMLIGNGFKQIDNLEKQNALLREQSEGLDVDSEKYQELLSTIEANEQAIVDTKISQEQWNDAIADLKIDSLTKEKEELQEVNDEYEKQIEYEEALQALDKAKSQRTKLVFREGIGFRYEADQEAIDAAQKRVDELAFQAKIDDIDNQIEGIEENKAGDNIYGYDGNTLANGIEIGSDGYYDMVEKMVNAPAEQAALISQMATKADALNAAAKNVSLSIGDINVSGVDNAEALAKDIVTNLPNILLQEIYK